MTVLGIILSLVPLALWVAWTETILLFVVAIGVASVALLVLLAGSETPATEDRRTAVGVATRRNLADQAVTEIHRIFPLTYHHSLIEKTRFRQAMDKVRRLLK